MLRKTHSHKRSFTITTDTHLHDEEFGFTPALHAQIEGIMEECQDKHNKKIIGKLTELIRQYPKTPQLKNYLCVAYSVRNKNKQAFETNRQLVAEHPDYLFGKLNLANQYLQENQPEKVIGVLGEDLELTSLYPGRKVFHQSEVLNFYRAAMRYFIAMDNLEMAEDRFTVLENVDADDPITEQARMELFAFRLKYLPNLWDKEKEKQIKVTTTKHIPTTKQSLLPAFHHAEMTHLYNNGMRIPKESLDAILALPRETAILDLENVLRDAVNRHHYFLQREFKEEQNSFPLHAVFLLGEMQSEKSFPLMLEFLSYEDDFVQFWFGDHLTETIWRPIYALGKNNLELLEQFLLQPGVNTSAKSAVSSALQQIFLNDPGKQAEITGIYERVLTRFNKARLEDNLIDSDMFGLIIGDIIDCGFWELLPLIKDLYEKGYVSEEINGTYEDVVQLSKRPLEKNRRKEILSIQDLYAHITSTWWGYTKKDEEYSESEKAQWKPAKLYNAGRNEPCPCGSGKKFKKCCIDKRITT